MNKYLRLFLIEMGMLAVMALIMWVSVYLAWYGFGLREGAMFAWLMLVTIPTALGAFFLVVNPQRRATYSRAS